MKEKIPDSPLTNEEWQQINEYFDEFPKPMSKEDRREFYDYLEDFVTPERNTTCLFCGTKLPPKQKSKTHKYRGGLCTTCKKAVNDRNIIRDTSVHRGYNKTRTKICAACGKESIYARDLCRSCYMVFRDTDCETTEEFLQMRDDVILKEDRKPKGRYKYLIEIPDIY